MCPLISNAHPKACCCGAVVLCVRVTPVEAEQKFKNLGTLVLKMEYSECSLL